MTYKVAVSKFSVSRKLPPGDPMWSKFNASFDNLDVETMQLVEAVYNGQAITTHHKNHWRTSENYICGQHIGLDFDNGDKHSTLAYLMADKFVSKYAAFAYTTMSHTDEAPRSRVIFLIDTPIMQAKNYTLAVASLLWLFGTADRQCKDAVRFFYGSKNCEFEYLDNTLPLEVVRKLITQYQETGQAEHRKATRKDYSAPVEQQEVADALRFIPPWGISYDEWLEVLMGIHSAFGENGYTLANAWADGKPGELEQKWKSFKSSGNGRGAVTIATVFGIAKRYGWKKAAYAAA